MSFYCRVGHSISDTKEATLTQANATFYTTAYGLTFVLMTFFAFKEYKFYKEKYGTKKGSPTKRVLFIQIVFTGSYLVRFFVNLLNAVSTTPLSHL